MKKNLLPTLTLLLLSICSLRAQDAHYWTEQFGNRSTLLTGAVIGSVDDLGAVYYNPGRLALQEDPTFLISAKAFQLVKLGVHDGNAEANLGSDVFGSAPTLAAGSFNLDSVKFLKFFHGHKFAYAFMSRTNFDYTLASRTHQNYAFNANWPALGVEGTEDLYSDFHWNKSVKEEWMGLTWAIPLSKHWAIGLTNFLTTFNQTASYSHNRQAIGLPHPDSVDQVEPVAIAIQNRNRSISTVGYVAKIGLSYDKDWFSAGLTITSPNAQITGSGSTLYEEALAGYENIDYPELNNMLKTNATSDVTAQTKSPLSIGLGAGINFGKNTLHMSAEWFNKVDQYYTLVPVPFEAQSSEEEIKNRYIEKRKSVINYGVGVEWVFSPKVSGYTSFATDFSALERTSTSSALDETDNFDNSIFSADIFHYGGGFSLSLKKMDLTLGVIYSRGIQNLGQVLRFPAEEGETPPPVEPTEVLWERFRILLGFSLPFYKFG